MWADLVVENGKRAANEPGTAITEKKRSMNIKVRSHALDCNEKYWMKEKKRHVNNDEYSTPAMDSGVKKWLRFQTKSDIVSVIEQYDK